MVVVRWLVRDGPARVMAASWMASREGLVWSSLVLWGCASGYGGSPPEWFVVAIGGVGGWGWQCVEESLYIYIYRFLVVWSLSVSLVLSAW